MTSLQMKYLLTYKHLQESERSITAVAIELGVNKSTVSRVFALTVKEGILNGKHQLTLYGTECLEQFSMKLEQMTELLCQLGLKEKKPKEQAYQILGACPQDAIEALLSNEKIRK